MTVWILRRSGGEAYAYERIEEVSKKMEIEVKIIHPDHLEFVVSEDKTKSIRYKGNPISLPSIVWARLGASSQYFDMALLRHFELLGVYVCNTASAIELAKDKFHSFQIFGAHHLPIPKTILAKQGVTPAFIENELTFPIIIKVSPNTHGKGIFLCQSSDQFEDVLDMVDWDKKTILLQEYIAPSHGKDLRVIVIGGKVLGAMQRTAPQGKLKANFHQGGSVESVEVTPEMEMLSVTAANLLGLEIAGVDLLFGDNGYEICEVNSNPGFEGFETATKIDYPTTVFEFFKMRTGNM